MRINTRRMSSRLTELQGKPALTESEAGELSAIIGTVADALNEDEAPVDLTLPGPTDVSIPVDVAEPVLTFKTVGEIHESHRSILNATRETRRTIMRTTIAGLAAIGTGPLAGAMGPAAAATTLTILKTIQAARPTSG